ncbi:MAG TPA: hypothetical protein PLL88_09660 [Anaerolineaceae bacterium]|jgi:hypothetical protein|nr:hypothetical protein [Anaerolineaceae bacterium]
MKKSTLPFWLGTFLGIGSFILALIVIFSFPDTKDDALPTAIVKITPYVPTATNSMVEQTEIASSQEQATALPGVFATNMRVRVSNTGGDGLKIHTEAGIESDTLTIASENSLWMIVEGPTIKESRIWWKIQSLDSAIAGWAVQDYLTAEYQ